jgi:S-adenosylmethionine decarboxylase
MMMMMAVVHQAFGPHLMMDCRECDNDKINDLDLVSKFLDELPELVGMTKIIPPYVFRYNGLVPEDKGITGVVIIAESHLTFHSFVEKDYFFFDIFSCKPFDVDLVEKHVLETFGVKDYERFDCSRGRNFPRHVSDKLVEASAVATATVVSV